MATNMQPPPTYAPVVLYDKNAKTPQELLASAKFNPIWLKWFLDLTAQVSTSGGIFVPYTGATKDVDLGLHALAMQRGAIDGVGGLGYLDFVAQSSNPAAPAAGVLRFHSSTTQGFTRFEQDNEAPTNLILGRDNVFIAKNTSGSNIAAGKPVYVTGSTGNVPNIALAKANSLTTLPAVGVTLDPINNNNFGQVMKLGIISSIDTSAFTAGALLYVSAATAGALTATRPVVPNFAQPVANVLVSGVGNGSLHIITAPFVGGQESGTSAASFAVQALSATGQVTAVGKTAFSVKKSANVDNVTGDGTSYTVTFATTIFDQDTSFSSNTTFTANTTGRYHLHGAVSAYNFGTAHTTIVLEVVTTARHYRWDWNFTSSNPFSQLTMPFSQLCDMTATDTATVVLTISGSTKTISVAAADTFFSGEIVG